MVAIHEFNARLTLVCAIEAASQTLCVYEAYQLLLLLLWDGADRQALPKSIEVAIYNAFRIIL